MNYYSPLSLRLTTIVLCCFFHSTTAKAQFEWYFQQQPYNSLSAAEAAVRSGIPVYRSYYEYVNTTLSSGSSKAILLNYGLRDYIVAESFQITGYEFGGHGIRQSEAEAVQDMIDGLAANGIDLCNISSTQTAEYELIRATQPIPFERHFVASEGGGFTVTANREVGGICSADTWESTHTVLRYWSGSCPVDLQPNTQLWTGENPNSAGYFRPILPKICSVGILLKPPFTSASIGVRNRSVCTPTEGNPCSPTNGNKFIYETDFENPRLSIKRIYISTKQLTSNVFGNGWTHNYSQRILVSNGYNYIKPNGTIELFKNSGGVLRSKLSPGTILVVVGDLAELTFENGKKELFEEVIGLGDLSDEFRLAEIHDPNVSANPTMLSYDVKTGLLASVTDPFGRTIQFLYADQEHVSSITLPDGTGIVYTYDADFNLNSVTYQDNKTKTYLYEDAS